MKSFKDFVVAKGNREHELATKFGGSGFRGTSEEVIEQLAKYFPTKLSAFRRAVIELEAAFGPIKWDRMARLTAKVSRGMSMSDYGSDVEFNGTCENGKTIHYRYRQGPHARGSSRLWAYDGGPLTYFNKLSTARR